MNIQEVHQTVSNMLSRRTNDMTRIKCKCWVYHSESRIRNGNEPFEFSHFIHGLDKDFYLKYIKLDLIDCKSIGGKEHAIEVVEHWFG